MTVARRGRPGYDLDTLLAIAVGVFNERGYDGTSMEDLSRRLGISKSAIYHHVSSKDELLRLALDRSLDELSTVLAETRRLDVPAISKLEHLVRGSVAVQRAALNRRRQFDRYVAGLVRQAEADGDVRPDVDPAVTARLLFGMVNSLVEWYRPAHSDLADAVCAIAFDGLRVRRE
jgi:AcrR family transcriptional regulator